MVHLGEPLTSILQLYFASGTATRGLMSHESARRMRRPGLQQKLTCVACGGPCAQLPAETLRAQSEQMNCCKGNLYVVTAAGGPGCPRMLTVILVMQDATVFMVLGQQERGTVEPL